MLHTEEVLPTPPTFCWLRKYTTIQISAGVSLHVRPHVLFLLTWQASKCCWSSLRSAWALALPDYAALYLSVSLVFSLYTIRVDITPTFSFSEICALISANTRILGPAAMIWPQTLA